MPPVYNNENVLLYNLPILIEKHSSHPGTGNSSLSNPYDDLIKNNNILIVNNINEERKPLVSLPLRHRLILSGLMMTSLLVGSFFKGIMYSCVLTTNKNNRGWMHRPINVLTVTSAIIHHATHLSIGIWYVIILMTESPIADIVGFQYCEIMDVVGLYGLVYLIVGSFGIAACRILYVKQEYWVKYVVGERSLLAIILILSISLCGILVFMFKLERSALRTHMNMCAGLSVTESQILIEYDVSRGMEMMVTTLFQSTVAGICIIMQTSEFVIYLWFFWHRYKMDNGNIRKLLTQDVIRQRNTKNISTFLGQFYCFLVEYAFVIAILILTSFTHEHNELLRAITVLVKLMDFGIMSAVEVLSSHTLRSFMK